MRINNNIMALNAHRQLGVNQSNASKSMERLSSGLRINRAADDAAGLAISEKMRGQVRGLKQASRNAQDGISLIQTAEGSLNETHSILQRMRELATQASNDTLEKVDREEIQKEINQLATEITRISTDTEFNNQKILDGQFSNKTFHIGANKDQTIVVSIANMSADQLGVGGTAGEVSAANSTGAAVTLAGTPTTDIESGNYTVVDVSKHATYGADGWKVGLADASGNIVALGAIDLAGAKAGTAALATNWVSVDDTSKALVAHDPTGTLDTGSTITVAGEGIDVSSTQGAANNAIDTINTAINTVSTERAKLGAVQNRLEHTISNLGTSAENLQAAESRIRDLDMAEEMMAFTKSNILNQAATAMLAQANMAPQSVLQLLG